MTGDEFLRFTVWSIYQLSPRANLDLAAIPARTTGRDEAMDKLQYVKDASVAMANTVVPSKPNNLKDNKKPLTGQ